MTTATTMAAKNKTPTTEPAMLPPETSIGGSRTAIHPLKKEKQKMNKQTEKNSHTVDFDEIEKRLKEEKENHSFQRDDIARIFFT